jgi:Tfp pilus assembly protein PilX
MNMNTTTFARRQARGCAARSRSERTSQRGFVLVIVMIFLVTISLLAATSLRNASSSESVMANVRSTEMATQSAEIALRHCEASVLDLALVTAGGASAYESTFNQANILPVSNPSQWQDNTIWDSTSTSPYILPLGLVNQDGMNAITYKRAPECMVEPIPIVLAGEKGASTTTVYVVTARGFGPEVATADAARGRPFGSEVWLQSHIRIQ